MRKLITKGEAANLLGLTKSQIRFYEQKGLLVPKTDENGYALYDFDEIDTLELIILLKDLNTPIKEMKRLINDEDTYDYVGLLRKSYAAINEEIEKLIRKKNALEQKFKAHEESEFDTFKIQNYDKRIMYVLEEGHNLNTIKQIYDLTINKNIGYLDYDNEFLIVTTNNEEYVGFLNLENKILDASSPTIEFVAGDYFSYIFSYDYDDSMDVFKNAFIDEAAKRSLSLSTDIIFIDHFGRKFYEKHKVIGTYQARIL